MSKSARCPPAVQQPVASKEYDENQELGNLETGAIRKVYLEGGRSAVEITIVITSFLGG